MGDNLGIVVVGLGLLLVLFGAVAASRSQASPDTSNSSPGEGATTEAATSSWTTSGWCFAVLAIVLLSLALLYGTTVNTIGGDVQNIGLLQDRSLLASAGLTFTIASILCFSTEAILRKIRN
jgi:hypothetical protein